MLDREQFVHERRRCSAPWTAAATRREIARLRDEVLAKDALIAKAMAGLEQWSGQLAAGGRDAGVGGT